MKRLLILVMTGMLLLLNNIPVLAAKDAPQTILQSGWTMEQLAQENNLETAVLITFFYSKS